MSEQDAIQPPVPVAEWIGDAPTGHLRLLDQTCLPQAKLWLECRDVPAVWDAIQRLVVRGAPAIGVAGAYGVVLAAQKIPPGADFLARLRQQVDYLEACRPTAVNLAWALRRMFAAAKELHAAGAPDLCTPLLAEAMALHAEDAVLCLEIGRHAATLLEGARGVLTHCNAGALATGGIGTATAGLYVAHAAGRRFTVYCDETRPLLQGARLTAWELQHAGIDAVVITDSTAGQVMKEGRVDLVITGADRIAANGDAANKIGTYGVAVLAARHRIPFYVAAPYSTFDLSISSGDEIPIEQRGGEEITEGFGRRTAPLGIRTYSPAFDVTPAELITAIITDRGIIRPVDEANVRALIGPALQREPV